MTNPTTGEVHFEARGETFTFKLGTNAQAMVEAKTGLSWAKYLKAKFEDIGASDTRLIFWAGLFRQHQMTEEDVGDLMDELGQERVAAIFLEAFNAASAKATNGPDKNPPRPAKARIGMNS